MTYRFAILGSRGYGSSYGGFETFVRHFARYVVDQGHQMTVYGRAGFSTRFTRSMKDGVSTVITPGIDTKTASTLSYGLTSSVHAVAKKYDAVLILNVANGYYLPLFRLARTPTAVNVDGLEWERPKWSRVGRSVFRLGAQATSLWADSLIADSQEIGSYWQRHWGSEFRFIPYGADLVDTALSERIHSQGISPGYLLAVACLVPENSIDLFLEVVRSLNESIPVVLVGSESGKGLYHDEARKLASNRENFRWLGHVSDQDLLSELWSNCAVYFHGHTVGGTNPSLLQAMAHGAAVVAVDTPFNREVLGGSGFLVPFDPGAVSSAVEQLWRSKEVARGLGTAARKRVQDHYSWETVCADYLDELITLASRSRSS